MRNTVVNPYNDIAQQNLLEDLIIEAIQMYGFECYYLPRTLLEVDPIYGEEEISQFNLAVPMEMYIMNPQGFSGEADFLGPAGYTIKDRLTFAIGRRRFDEVLRDLMDTPRPQEGDLVWFPLTGGFYEIMFVEQEQAFYQIGKLNTYQLVSEIFTYSNEQFNTGIPSIDVVEATQTTDTSVDDLVSSDGDYIITSGGHHIRVHTTPISEQDPLADNDVIADEAAGIIDFSITNPFSE